MTIVNFPDDENHFPANKNNSMTLKAFLLQINDHAKTIRCHQLHYL